MSGSWVILFHFLLIFSHGRSAHGLEEEENGSMMKMVPKIEEEGKTRMVSWVELNESRRRLGSFQVCGICNCCGGLKGVCLPSPCCYAINCNIPNKPFGFCSFSPKTCNCFGCHL